MIRSVQWRTLELSFESNCDYDNPYMDVRMWIDLAGPAGERQRVYGFWDGGRTWRVRFAPPTAGEWQWSSDTSERGDVGLGGLEGRFEVMPYDGPNPVYAHGFLQLTEDRRGFCHKDGTPFFWLADVVWAAPSRATLDEWTTYLRVRKQQRFTVCEMNALPQHDASGGVTRQPFLLRDGRWDPTRINVEYFQYLDRLMAQTVESGIVPVLSLIWFNFVEGTHPDWNVVRPMSFTLETATAWVRYAVARYAAFGTVWFVSCDTDFTDPEAMALYDGAAVAVKEADLAALVSVQFAGCHYTNPDLNRRPWLDFHAFQTGHVREASTCVRACATGSRVYEPTRPIVNAEGLFDGIGYYLEEQRADRAALRRVAWLGLLDGATAGIAYGVHGLWSWTRPGEPFADAALWQMPYPWRGALRRPSALDFSRMRELLEGFRWWQLVPTHGVLAAGSSPITVAVMPDFSRIVAYGVDVDVVTLRVPEGPVYGGAWFDPTGTTQWPAQVIRNGGELTVLGNRRAGDVVLILAAR